MKVCPGCDEENTDRAHRCERCGCSLENIVTRATLDSEEAHSSERAAPRLGPGAAGAPGGTHAGPAVDAFPRTGFVPGHLVGDGEFRVVGRLARRGAQAEVWECVEARDPSSRVVAKVYEEPPMDEADYQNLQRLDAADILRVLRTFWEEGRFVEVSEFAAGGSLEDCLREERQFSVAELRSTIAPQANNAVRRCHDARIVHRDLKPANLFFRDLARTDLVLGDFGSTLKLDRSHRVGDWVGSFSYQAPEAQQSTAETRGGPSAVYRPEGDFFALGKTLLTLFVGHDPEEGHGFQALVDRHADGEWGELFDRYEIPPTLSQLLRGLLHPDYRARFGWREVEAWCRGEAVVARPYPPPRRPSILYELGKHRCATEAELAARLRDSPDVAAQHLVGKSRECILFRRLAAVSPEKAARVAQGLELLEAAGFSSVAARLVIAVHVLDPGLPFRLATGLEAQSPEELAAVIDADGLDGDGWRAARERFGDGSIDAWLWTRLVDENWTRYQTWRNARPAVNADATIELLLHFLSETLPWPRPEVSPRAVDFGRVEWKETRELDLTVRNRGRGYLFGTIALGETFAGLEVPLQQYQGNESRVRVRLDSGALVAGKTYGAELAVSDSGGTAVTVPIGVAVTFPRGRLRTALLFHACASAAVFAAWRTLLGISERNNLTEYLSWPSAQTLDAWQWFLAFLPPAVWLVAVLARNPARAKSLNATASSGGLGCLGVVLLFGVMVSGSAFTGFGAIVAIDSVLERIGWITPLAGWAIVGAILGVGLGLWNAAPQVGAPRLRPLAALLIAALLVGLGVPALNLAARGTQARPTATAAAVPEWVVVTGTNLNLRTTPSLDGQVAGRVPRGTVLGVRQGQGGWYQVLGSDDRLYWVAQAYTQPAAAPANASTGQAAAILSLPFEDEGACPFEGCVYREWMATAALDVFKERRVGSPVAYRVRQGEKVVAVSGVVVTRRAGRARATRQLVVGRSVIAPGQEVLVLHYQGEGFWLVWHEGATASVGIGGLGSDLVQLAEPVAEWWVLLKNGGEQRGWTNQPDLFENKDQFAGPAVPDPDAERRASSDPDDDDPGHDQGVVAAVPWTWAGAPRGPAVEAAPVVSDGQAARSGFDERPEADVDSARDRPDSQIVDQRSVDEPANRLIGVWEGTVDQPAREHPVLEEILPGFRRSGSRRGTQYPVRMTITHVREGDVIGTIEYPSIPCSGTLTLRGAGDREYVVREQIIEGKRNCVNRGSINLRFEGRDTLSWVWTGVAGVAARATLRRPG